MRSWSRILAALPMLLASSVTGVATARAATELPPAPDEFVTDRANVLSPEVESELNGRLEAFESETSNQVVVYVDRRIPEGRELEELAADAFEAWGIGQADRDNGVLFLVFTEDRRARIEVGYGLEGAFPDALAAQVLEEQAFPRFRDGDWEAGVRDGVEGIIDATRGEYEGTGETGDSQAEEEEADGWITLIFLVIILFSWLRQLLWRLRRSRRGLLGRTIGPNGWLSTYWPVPASGESSSGSFWGGGGGGGGFSGGGGSSGGGGASGSW